MKGVRAKILPFGGNAMGSQELGGLLDLLYVASHIVDKGSRFGFCMGEGPG